MFCLLAVLSLWAASAAPVVQWTMVNVNTSTQGDAHIIRFPSGDTYLIDAGGDDNRLIPFLSAAGIQAIQKIIVSHPHKDHYSGIRAILNSTIRVESVFLNLPDKGQCEKEIPWGCDYKDITNLVDLLQSRKIPVLPIRAGEKLHEKDSVILETLYAFEEKTSPIKGLDINDNSAILLLTVGKIRALFPGDLNQTMGSYLAKHGKRLRAEILKVPHHAAESVAPNEFFDRVAPKLALVPAPKSLWHSDRTRRVRDYLSNKKIETHVNGLDGDITLCLNPRGFRIHKGKPYLCEIVADSPLRKSQK